uniref:Thioredoxin-dependent peroxide reductase, mitochondrial n=1 Tax=Bubo bubo TaxID=30461 RepID=A0A8C0IH57_BUBBB
MVPAANRPGTNLQSRRRPRTHIQLNAALPISSSKCLGGKLGNDFGTAVVNGEFKELSLDDFKGKYLVLFFYPLDFTFVCPTEIVAFSNKANEFHDVNCDVVAVSVDSHFCHLAWINTPRKSGGLGKMNIPVLSDLTKQISRDYGVLLEGPGIALRGLFIIDPNGIIKHLSINDLPVGRSVEETLRLVKAFQYVETHGEVCPANWTPDSPTNFDTWVVLMSFAEAEMNVTSKKIKKSQVFVYKCTVT